MQAKRPLTPFLMKKSTLLLKDIHLKPSQIHKFRGFIGNLFRDYDLIHNHDPVTDADIAVFDKAMISAIPFCRTRSKIGQTPRLYLRVELANSTTFLKDLREPLRFVSDDDFRVRGIDEFKVDINGLVKYLSEFEAKIEKLHYWKDENLQLEGWDKLENVFSDKMNLVDPTQE